ncbi:unnamed protein product [Trichobilharzia szidati]|nr:unnamed protein product [Trichobilharzia szidati]
MICTKVISCRYIHLVNISEYNSTNETELVEEATKTGLQVNIDKTEVMKITNQQQQQQQQHPAPITINGRDLKEVTSFTHLSREHCLNYTRNGRECQVENRDGEKHIHQPETNLEIFITPQHQQQNLDFQHKRQVSSSIRIRNLAGHKEYFQQPVADLYQQLSSFYTEDQMAGRKESPTRNYGNKQNKNQSPNKYSGESGDGLDTR